jgi:hypothetical protein
MKKQNNIILYDIVLYVIFPIVLFRLLKPFVGEYWAMIIPTIPGILYTIFRFWYTKQFNVTGLFIISTMSVSTTVDLISGSGYNLILYNVYYHYALVVVFILLILLKKPLTLYFSLDIVAIQGHDGEKSKKLFFHKEIFKYFQYLFIFWALKDVLFASIQWWLLVQYGTKAYYSRTILFTIGGYVFGIFMAAGYFYIAKKVNKLMDSNTETLANSN